MYPKYPAFCSCRNRGQTLSEDELINDLPALRSGAGNHDPPDFRGALRLAVARGSTASAAQRSRPDTDLRRGCLRYVSSVQMIKPRFATRDVVWQVRQFRRGDMF